MAKPLELARTYASFVKLSHTVFALPFALAAFVAALVAPLQVNVLREYGEAPFERAVQEVVHASPSWRVALLCLACMVGARSFAMAFNRLADRKIDALNPRTMSREIPAGRLNPAQAWAFAISAALLYFGACALLGPVVMVLSPLPIGLMVLYSYTKRFTWLSHIVLGASLGLAPIGAWVAVRAGGWNWLASQTSTMTIDRWVGTQFFRNVSASAAGPDEAFLGWMALTEWLPWLIAGAVTFWVAGFDIIYALQDDEFDRQQGLKSIPARFGRKAALRISTWFHVASFGLLGAAGKQFGDLCGEAHLLASLESSPTFYPEFFEGTVHFVVLVFGVGLIRQHVIVKPNDLSRVNAAFFTVNGIISLVVGLAFLACYLAAIWL